MLSRDNFCIEWCEPSAPLYARKPWTERAHSASTRIWSFGASVFTSMEHQVTRCISGWSDLVGEWGRPFWRPGEGPCFSGSQVEYSSRLLLVIWLIALWTSIWNVSWFRMDAGISCWPAPLHRCGRCGIHLRTQCISVVYARWQFALNTLAFQPTK